MCCCVFAPDETDDGPGWHYFRTCLACRHTWYGVHCVHDDAQNPCPACGLRPIPVLEPEENRKVRMVEQVLNVPPGG